MSNTPPPLPPSGPGDSGTPPPGGYGTPPPPYGGQPGYGYGYGYPAQREHPQGTTILVLGIVGIAVCPIAAPVAWVMGNTALREIDANPAMYSNRSSVQAGRIMGIVITIGYVVFVVAAFLLLILAGMSSGS